MAMLATLGGFCLLGVAVTVALAAILHEQKKLRRIISRQTGTVSPDSAATTPPDQVAESVTHRYEASDLTKASALSVDRARVGRAAGAGRDGSRKTSFLLAEMLGKLPTSTDIQSYDTRYLVFSNRSFSSLASDVLAVRATPSLLPAQFESTKPHAVILEEECFTSGQWEGTLNTEKSANFLEVWDLLTSCRRSGVISILIPENLTPSHFSADLAGAVDVVLSEGAYSFDFGSDVKIDILDDVNANFGTNALAKAVP